MARARQAREKEWAKLRAMQQRDIDRRGEVDLQRAMKEQERIDRLRAEQETYIFPLLILVMLTLRL